ncbi:MAG: helix-turn-helix transcriptional regulator [Candidatus Hodarchaeales archaeon]
MLLAAWFSHAMAAGPPENAGSGRNSSFELLLLVALLILLVAVIILILAGYWHFKMRSRTDQMTVAGNMNPLASSDEMLEVAQKEAALSVASDIKDLEQQRILKVLIQNGVIQNGGQMLQKELPEATNMSKSTISRLITQLEAQGAISRSPYKKSLLVKITFESEKPA